MSSGKSDTGGPSRLTARAKGAMLAAACGDALGWPIEPRGRRVGGVAGLQPRLEFIEWRRREGGSFAPFQRPVPAGAYSDDTQLMLAVARSLTRGEAWWEHLTQLELPAWIFYELGGGGAIRRAARSWARGQAPWEAKKADDRRKYFAAGANGVAMRILPHAIFGAEDGDFGRVGERIVADGITTHGHPRALIGALAAGYAMWSALRWNGKVHYGELIEDCLSERQTWARFPESEVAPGWREAVERELDGPYEELWALTREEMIGLLTACQDAMGRGSLARDEAVFEDLGLYGKEGGSGTRTAAAAIYLASRYVAKPSAGLLAAAFARRTDADTIACLTGAVLGAFAADRRVDGIAAGLQDVDYIERLAGQVAQREEDRAPLSRWTTRTKSRAEKELLELNPGGQLSLPLFGECRVLSMERPETKSANEVTIWWLSTQLGQTLAVTKIKKVPAGKEGDRPQDRTSAKQMTMEEANRDQTGKAPSTWTFLFVKDLHEALNLYSTTLGIPVIRARDQSAVLEGHLVLEEAPGVEQGGDEALRAPQVIGVFVRPEALIPLHARVTAAGHDPSDIGPGRNGKRFRLRDLDGHVVEVFTSHPSR